MTGRDIEISRDKYGMRYRLCKNCAWKYLPDNAVDEPSIQNYLTDNGRLDPVNLTFIDSSGIATTTIGVRRTGNKVESQINGDTWKELHYSNFISTSELIDFFAERATDAVRSQAERMQSDEQLRHYKKNATPEALTEYRKLITDDKIKEHFKKVDPGAEVFFL